MSNSQTRDKKRRLLVAKYELKRMEYKAICQDLSLPYHIRYLHFAKLSQLPRNSSKTRIRNRCIMTGRSRSVYRKFRLSRIVFREYASRGDILGISKSSW